MTYIYSLLAIPFYFSGIIYGIIRTWFVAGSFAGQTYVQNRSVK